MFSVPRDYIASERFIHRDLLRQAEAAVKTIYKSWRKEQKITPVLFTWPAETVRTEAGEPLEGICVLILPEESGARSVALREMVGRTKAYALLLIEQHSDEVRATFESMHGARCWSIPLAPHGGVVLLERARVQDDGPCVGLLWSPGMGRS